jgi:hypothetical protein
MIGYPNPCFVISYVLLVEYSYPCIVFLPDFLGPESQWVWRPYLLRTRAKTEEFRLFVQKILQRGPSYWIKLKVKCILCLFCGLIITECFNRQKDVDSKKIFASKSYSSEVFLKVRYANLYLQNAFDKRY